MTILNTLVLIAALACTYLGHARFLSTADKRNFSVLAGLCCGIVAFDALMRHEYNSAIIFAIAAFMNLARAFTSNAKPANPDA